MMRYIGIVFFCSVILTAAISKKENTSDKENELLATRRQKRSMIFFPAEKNTIKPLVSHKRYPSPKRYRRRFRRNVSKKEMDVKTRDTTDNFLDYNGWQPLSKFDPMSEEPTLIYKPPSLERVHFGMDPPKEKPLYPVLPVNPPVYVIRAEPAEREVHAIYGTENINYLHVNPKTQQAKAYSAFGKNRYFERDSLAKNLPPKTEKTNSSSFSLSNILKSFVHNIIEKEDLFNSTNTESKVISETPKIEVFPYATNFTALPEVNTEKNTAKNSYFHNDNLQSNHTVNSNSSTESSVNPTNVFLEKENEILNSQFSVKSLAIDDDYYYIYEDEAVENADYDSQVENKQSQVEDKKEISESDPFASIIPEFPNADNYKYKRFNDSEENENKEYEYDPYHAEASEMFEKKTSVRAPLHKLLRNFGGVQSDQYIFSASENREKSFTNKDPHTVSRSRLTIPFKPQVATGRKINSPPLGVSNNNRDWYLIETRSKPVKDIDSRWKNSFDDRDYFIDRPTSKYSESQNLYKSFNENKLSLKNHESLTANSLSELLQIFKYVTTPNPIQRFSDFNAFQSRQRTFRYTKPTEPPNRAKYFTTFRYTVPVSKPIQSTEPTTDVDVHGINDPSKVINDTVAETNSLDGYLFSDSVSDPKYTRPDAQPNIVKVSEKRATYRKSTRVSKEKAKMDKDAVQRGDIAPPFVIEVKETDAQPFYDSYLIHQGHSRVKVYGLNSDHKEEPEFTTQRSKRSTLDHILMTPKSSSNPTTAVTTSPPKVSVTQKIITKRQTKSAKSLASSEFLDRMDIGEQVTVSKNIPRWTRYYSEKRLKEKQNNGSNLPSPFRIFSDLFYKYLR